MKNFISSGIKMDPEMINKYKDSLPIEIIDLWCNYGFCKILDGFLRTINPEEFKGILEKTYFMGRTALPLFITAFGDIIFIQEDGYIGVVRYRYNNFNILTSDFKHFLMYLKIDKFVNTKLKPYNYYDAIEKIGSLKNDECYGYFPLLCAGGKESVDNIKIVKTIGHIILITQFVGTVGE